MASDVEEVDRVHREAWARAASAWERHQAELRETTAPVSDWLVRAIDPQPGERLLELAAGPGETGFIAAERIGPSGTLLSSDQAEEMVAVARRRAAELGLENVQFTVLDAQRLELDDDQFDAVLCRFGYMLMADRAAALAETRRVLKREGRLALAVWDNPHRNLWMAAPPMTLVSRGAMPMPEPDAPTPFSLADPAQLTDLLAAAGFSEIQTALLEFEQTYRSFDHYWEITLDLAAPVAAAVAALDAAVVAEVRSGVRDALAQFVAQDGTMAVPASALMARAVAGTGT